MRADANGNTSERKEIVSPQSSSNFMGQFLHSQQASGEISLDMDSVMDELRMAEAVVDSTELKMTFSPPKDVAVERGRRSDLNDSEVVRCTSNGAHHRKPTTLLRTKTTKSRLSDPVGNEQQNERESGKVTGKPGQLNSGYLSRRTEEDEDDPLKDVELPDEYKKFRFGLVTMAEWIIILLIIAALVCSLTIPVLKPKSLWNLKLWKWEVLVLVLICGRLVSGWFISVILMFLMTFSKRARVLYYVSEFQNTVQKCLWSGLLLLAWHFLSDQRVNKEMDSKPLHYVTKVLVCFLTGTLIWLVKELLMRVLTSRYQCTMFYNRIHYSHFKLDALETLSGPPLIEMKLAKEEEQRLAEDMQRHQSAGANIPPELKESSFMCNRTVQDGKRGGMERALKLRSHTFPGATPKKQDDDIPIDHYHRMNPKNVSAWNMEPLMNIIRHGSLTTLDEQLLDAMDEKQRSEVEAKVAAEKIFQNVAKPRSKHIYLEDLMRFMEKDKAEKTLNLFEGAPETGKISKSCLQNWVVNAFREQRAVMQKLINTATAARFIHKMVNAISGIIIGIVCLIILGIATSKVILFVTSQLAVAAIVFGNTLKTVFEGIIFLVVVHPFEVGDMCEIDGGSGRLD